MGKIRNFHPISRRISETVLGYYDGLIGSCICAFNWYQGRWPNFIDLGWPWTAITSNILGILRYFAFFGGNIG